MVTTLATHPLERGADALAAGLSALRSSTAGLARRYSLHGTLSRAG